MTLRRLPANTFYRLLAIPLVLWLAWQIGVYAGRSGITYLEIVSGALAISGIIMLGRGQAGIRFGYFIWILTLALGYRTIPVGQHLRLHPLVLLITALMIMLLVNKVMEHRSAIRIFIPRWLGIFVVFLAWGMLNALFNRLNTELAIIVLMTMGIVVPITVLTYHVVVTERDWVRAIQFFYFAAIIIAFFGLLEFFFPEARNLLPGLIAAPVLGVDQFGFSRASFSFFGHPIATLVCALALPFVVFLYTKASTASERLALLAGALLMVGAIYIGGYRSVWLTLGIVFVALFVLRRDFARLIVLLVVFAVIYAVTPQAGRDRFGSLISAIEGEFVDSSALKRAMRIEVTLQMITENPLGVGLSGSGWAHSDVLQITAETGWLGGIAFSLWFLHSLYRLGRRFMQHHDPLDESLLASMFVVMSIFIFQTVMVLPQLSAPAWLIWALVEVRLERVRMAETVQQPQPLQQFMRPHHFAR
ncbi:MAG: hypothetical protein CUN53_00870 [Phototrophicales bacterium]|nr:MAG: hypothetical protein CUN53_00870 [Phototrophicales bacterium]